MVEPLNLVRSRRYEGLIFMGPARSGKTIALGDGVIAYSIVDDPADCMVVEKSKGRRRGLQQDQTAPCDSRIA